jgi:GNAT superfamily N-acetyltransferase
MPHEEWTRGDYTISTDPSRLDVDVIHSFLRTAYWAGEHLPREIVERSIENSLCFGVYVDGAQAPSPAQVGFARAITDYATFAYVADVFILPEHRGKKLGVWLMECVASHPRLQNLRRWMLGTRDAHTLYEKTGWTRIAPDDERWMERSDPDVYRRLAEEDASR